MHPALLIGGFAFAAIPALREFALKAGMKAATTGIKYGAKASWWGLKAGAGVISREGPGIASMARKTAGFAIRHPYLVAGGIGAGLAINAAPTFASPTEHGYYMRSSYNQEQIAAEQMQGGILPTGNMTTGAQIRNQRFAQSTFGLVQGLHQGRH